MGVTAGEIADAGVEPALLHGLLRQQEEGGVEHHRHHAGFTAGGQAVGPGGAGGVACGLVVGEGLGHRHLRIDGIGADALDIAGIGLDGAQVVLLLGGGIQREDLEVSFEEAVRLDAGGAFGGFLLGLEGGDDGVLGADAHRLGNGIGLRSLDVHDIGPEKEVAGGGLLPVEHDVVHFLTAILAGAHGVGREAGDGQDAAAQQGVGNLQVPVLFVLGHGEEALGEVQLDGRSFLLFIFFLFFAGIRLFPLGLGREAEGQGKEEQKGSFHII